jgi:ammonium transporter, Amt family
MPRRLHLLLIGAALAVAAGPAFADPPKLEEVAKAVADTTVAINFMWTLIGGFLVMFMQAGFAMVETGFTRAKNASHTMAMNLMVYGIAMAGYWLCGYALQAGGVGALSTLGNFDQLNREISISIGGKSWGLFGFKGFLLMGVAYNASAFAYFLFQMVFMDTGATIPTGALAERWKFSAFCLFSFFVGALIYPVFANWGWGGGWLSALGANSGLGNGYVDFAGSGVVHMTGGVMSLVGAKLLGARRGKFNADGTPNALPGHNIPMAMLGTFILMFGWFGFNSGSTLAGSDNRIAVIAANTMLAGAAGSISAMLYVWFKFGKPDPSMMANGALAGLVAITAPCAFVTAPSAVVIGLVAGVIVCAGVTFIERTLKVDDPVGAISVHGLNGAWGVLAVGIFADGTYGGGTNNVAGNVTGLLYGHSSQLLAQVIGMLSNWIWVGGATFAVWKVVGLLVRGHRVPPEVEEAGLDSQEMGIHSYPPDAASHLPLPAGGITKAVG